jgi:hypothetical protein
VVAPGHRDYSAGVTDYCRVDDEHCGRIAVGECSFCRRPRCVDHFVRSFPAVAVADRPERERERFLAAANGLTSGWACVPCRAEAGDAAVAAMPARPALPDDPVEIVLMDRRTPGRFTPDQIDAAVGRAGGYESVLRRIYAQLAPTSRPRRFGSDRNTVHAHGIPFHTVQTGGPYTETVSDDRMTRTQTAYAPTVFLVVNQDGRVFRVDEYQSMTSTSEVAAREVVRNMAWIPDSLLESAAR